MRDKIKYTQIAFEDKLVRISLLGFLLPTIVALIFLFNSDLSIYFKWLLTFIICVVIFFTALSIRQLVIFQLRTSTNLVEAMTSGDYSLRANNKGIKGALADFNQLLNALANRLSTQRLITREKQILLSKITDHIDVAVIAVDDLDNIALMNPAAEQLFHQRFDELQGWPISSIGLQDALKVAKQGNINKVSEFEIGENKRKVYVRTDAYFERNKPHYLIFITDIQHLLRDEERLAWQRLLRVLSHEINNSLTPISSIAETLSLLVKSDDVIEKSINHQSMKDGLSVISERAQSLNVFIQQYQKLTRLPSPDKTVFGAREFLSQTAQLFEESTITLPNLDVDLFADREQLQQVFINLLKNAEEANRVNENKQSTIYVTLAIKPKHLIIEIRDEGAGIHNQDNIFVPFYTTKKNGSGIGLILSRQIILNHGGELSLANASEGGALATIKLPIS